MEKDGIYARVLQGFNNPTVYANKFDYLTQYSLNLPSYSKTIKEIVFDEAQLDNAINQKYREVIEKQQSYSVPPPSVPPPAVPPKTVGSGFRPIPKFNLYNKNTFE